MRTIVYVDGFNFYYSLLKYSNFKWLDLFCLFDKHILKPQNPSIELLTVKYYTANIKSKFATSGSKAEIAQQTYHRALLSKYTGNVEIIKGKYHETKDTPMRYRNPPDKNDRVEVWKLEEKQTDVNIALDLYRDVVRHECEQVVICSNDTDLVPALKYIKGDFPSIKIGIIFPRLRNSRAIPSKSLADYADWTRRHITEDELEKSLFNDRVPTGKKPADKPDYW